MSASALDASSRSRPITFNEASELHVYDTLVLASSWLNTFAFAFEIALFGYYFSRWRLLALYRFGLIVLLVNDTLATLCIYVNTYESLVTSEENPIVISTFLVSTGLSALVEQSILVHRYWKFSKHTLFCALLMLLSGAHFLLSIVSAAYPLHSRQQVHLTTMAAIVCSVADILIAFSTVWTLSGISPVWRSTQAMIRAICLNALASGAVVAVVTLLAMVSDLLKETEKASAFGIFFQVMGRVYSLTILVNFIQRRRGMGVSQNTGSDAEADEPSTHANLHSIQFTTLPGTSAQAPSVRSVPTPDDTLDKRPGSRQDFRTAGSDQATPAPIHERYELLRRQFLELEEKNKEMSTELERTGEQSHKMEEERNALLERISELENQPGFVATVSEVEGSETAPLMLSSTGTRLRIRPAESPQDGGSSSETGRKRSRDSDELIALAPDAKVPRTETGAASAEGAAPPALPTSASSEPAAIDAAPRQVLNPYFSYLGGAAPPPPPFPYPPYPFYIGAMPYLAQPPPATFTPVPPSPQRASVPAPAAFPSARQTHAAKPKRLKAHTVTSKSYSIPVVPRDKLGKPLLPLNVGIMRVLRLGDVCMREHFHTERYIFPVGYEVTRRYLSTVDPHAEVVYHCSILDGGDGPKFQIIPSDAPERPVISGTATGAWSGIVKTANALRRRQHSNSVSGPDFFGLGQNTIKHLIQELPNSDRLRDYVWQHFVEGGPLGGRHAAVVPALPEEYESVVGRIGAAGSASAQAMLAPPNEEDRQEKRSYYPPHILSQTPNPPPSASRGASHYLPRTVQPSDTFPVAAPSFSAPDPS
ncbi:unnamed protein product [Mycena citricolor]|uniref:DUF6534 domain-containing protein n=1 Tax=Mycena citricolor TaxID=2018698 RepID=A0AAD2H701_9AGAR|nr:unnamed protein product [Mycena citricolor]